MKIVLSLLLPLLFIGSVVVIIYSIILFAKAQNKGDKHLRKRALTASLFPIIYIVTTLIYFGHRSKMQRSEYLQKIPGVYVYDAGAQNSLKSEITLNTTNQFWFENLQQPDSITKGKWFLQKDNWHIEFYDIKNRLLWRSTWANTYPAILDFENGREKINFLKVE